VYLWLVTCHQLLPAGGYGSAALHCGSVSLWVGLCV